MVMKYLYILFALFPLLSFGQQHWQVGSFLVTDVPNHSVMPKMSPTFGIGLQVGYKPVRFIPVSFELKANLGTYSNRTLQQTFIFDSTSSTTTDVTYSSGMNRLNFGAKVHLLNEFRAIRPYITPQIGYSFMRSRIAVADPQDEDDCQPLDKTTVQRFSGLTYGGELGVEVSMERLFKNVASENKHRLYASVTFLNSFNQFEYINIKYMEDHDHAAMTGGDHSGHTSPADGRDVNTQFVNVTTNAIHEHKIAELYQTHLRFWGINVGYVFNF